MAGVGPSPNLGLLVQGGGRLVFSLSFPSGELGASSPQLCLPNFVGLDSGWVVVYELV